MKISIKFLTIIIAIPLLLKADEKTMKILDKAYIHALNKEYQQAIDKTFPLLDSLSLNVTDEIVLAHQILSLSYCETGNKEKAVEHLQALHTFAPKENFRVFALSPEYKKLLHSSTPSNKKKK